MTKNVIVLYLKLVAGTLSDPSRVAVTLLIRLFSKLSYNAK
jgi:hypothetical protein